MSLVRMSDRENVDAMQARYVEMDAVWMTRYPARSVEEAVAIMDDARKRGLAYLEWDL